MLKLKVKAEKTKKIKVVDILDLIMYTIITPLGPNQIKINDLQPYDFIDSGKIKKTRRT